MRKILAHPDRIAGATLALVGLFLLYSARSLPFGRLNAPDAGFFPIILTVLLTVFGLALVVQSFRTDGYSLEMEPRSWLVPVCVAAIVLYALLINRAGFILCTTAILLFLAKAYGGLSWGRSLLYCVPAVLAVYVGFSELGVPLPRGILGWF
jgi:putative tricarboxylic transport membrane protein